MEPLITNDAIVLGILLVILAFVFKTSNSELPFWKKFYTYIPSLLLCYFVPSIFNSTGVISGDYSNLYFISSRYLLPASLVLLTISIDLKRVIRLGPKALIMFFTATMGIVIGGPLAIIIVSAFAPEVVGGSGADAVWRGLTTIAGSWIGGSANQTAMKEVFNVSDNLFSAVITVDVIVTNIWLALLLYGAGISKKLDALLKADTSALEEVKNRVAIYRARIAKIPNLSDVTVLLAIGFGTTAIAHWAADIITPFIKTQAPGLAKFSLTSEFFWIIVIATGGGLILSLTKIRELEGVGASTFGSLLLYILVASIGMKMNILAIFDNPGLFMVAALWILFHITLLLVIGKIIRAPFFFVAVGSQANIGGAASAPIVASAFHPALAPVGVLLAVLGYALGTYMAWVCGILMQMVAP